MRTKINKSLTIISPHITEKASYLGALNKYIFKVHPKANKVEIKKAVREIFKVSPQDVKVLQMPSKKRSLGSSQGRQPGYKKAIVTLKPGDKIDVI